MNKTLHDALLALEKQLLDPAVRRDRAAVERLLAEEFAEVGRSGKTYDREAVLDLLASEAPLTGSAIRDFKATALGANSAFATYTSVVDGKSAHRVSVWMYREGRWQMLYHQGTLAAL